MPLSWTIVVSILSIFLLINAVDLGLKLYTLKSLLSQSDDIELRNESLLDFSEFVMERQKSQ